MHTAALECDLGFQRGITINVVREVALGSLRYVAALHASTPMCSRVRCLGSIHIRCADVLWPNMLIQWLIKWLLRLP